MANLNRGDLDFVLQQILISESDSAAQIAGNFDTLPVLVGSPLLPNGVRNVNGTYNNLITGQSTFGAADQVFPRLLPPNFKNGENVPVGFGLIQTSRKEVQHPILKPVVWYSILNHA